MKVSENFKILFALVVLGNIFRALYGILNPPFIFYIILIDGTLSGIGVFLGIKLSDSEWVKELTKKWDWTRRLIPYFCGGLGVLLGKVALKIFEPAKSERQNK